MKPKALLRTAMSAPILMAAAYGCSQGIAKFDAATYLNFQCEGNPTPVSRSIYETELTNGQSLKLSGFSIKSVGSGRIAVKGPTKDGGLFDTVQQDTVLADSENIYINQKGIEYKLTAKEGSQDSTHLEISRSCERK